MLQMAGPGSDLILVTTEPAYNGAKKMIEFRIRNGNLHAEVDQGGSTLSFGRLDNQPEDFKEGHWYYIFKKKEGTEHTIWLVSSRR